MWCCPNSWRRPVLSPIYKWENFHCACVISGCNLCNQNCYICSLNAPGFVTDPFVFLTSQLQGKSSGLMTSGYACGYLSSICYLSSRFPQLHINVRFFGPLWHFGMCVKPFGKWAGTEITEWEIEGPTGAALVLLHEGLMGTRHLRQWRFVQSSVTPTMLPPAVICFTVAPLFYPLWDRTH